MMLGLLMAISTYITLRKMVNVKLIIGYQAMLDVLITALYFMICGSTNLGFTAAVSGGLFFTTLLLCVSKFKGPGTRLRRIKTVAAGKTRHHWIEVPLGR